MKTVVTFSYYPDDPDPADRSGISAEEYDELMEALMALGADEIDIVKVDDD